jgi:hypothetical protein
VGGTTETAEAWPMYFSNVFTSWMKSSSNLKPNVAFQRGSNVDANLYSAFSSNGAKLFLRASRIFFFTSINMGCCYCG